SLLEQIETSAPDILVLDWELPGVSGLDVLQFVRERRDEITLPILILTSDEQAMVVALNAGANDFVAKPCPDVVLRARIQTLLRLQHLSERIRVAEQERTDALERVYDAETRMYVALESADIGTWELDPHSELMQLDASGQEIMGLPSQQLLRVEAERAIHAD